MDLLQPDILLQLCIDGLLAGALYALLACGLNLVFGVMGIINLAHAELMLVGSFITYALYTNLGLHPLVSLPIVIGLLFLFGYGLQRVLIERVVGQGELPSLMVTYGLAIILMNAGILIVSSDFKSIPELQGALLAGNLVISKPRGIAAIVAVFTTFAVFLFLKKSRLGKAIRAVAEHPEVALICGIDVIKIRMLAFAMATAMAGAAGVMLTMIYSFSPESGADFILKCFAVIVIGGMGHFIGAFYGGLLLGVTEVFVSTLLSSQWAEGVAYLMLLVILIVKPSGLAGKRPVS